MNTKKLICFMLVVVFIALSATAVYGANNEIERSPAICRDIDLLRGDVNGVGENYLSLLTTRLQAMHLTLRLMGKEEFALSYVWLKNNNFSDVDIVDYQSGKNLLAYIKAHPDLGWQGDRMGNIDPEGNMTAQAMYKVLLSVLGYVPEEDFSWDDTLAFAGGLGMRALAAKPGYLNNGEVAVMIVEALKTRMKDSDDTLCEYLVKIGAIDDGRAYDASILPGSPGFTPLIPYKDGGPLLVEVNLTPETKTVSIRFNAALNPTYAKSLNKYCYYKIGNGYNPLPGGCKTSMADEYTVEIKFPEEGWYVYNDRIEADAFRVYIATARKNELKASGLLDVDGALLRDLFIDVPPMPGDPGEIGAGSRNRPGDSDLRPRVR